MEQTPAASSPAEVADVFNGENVSFAEFTRYRHEGVIPERFKPAEPAESAPADAPEQTAEESEGEEPEIAPESEPESTQEPPQKVSPAEKRIKQLLARTKELERQLTAKQDAKPDSSPAPPQQPQNYQDWRKTFKPAEWVAQYGAQNPEASYEDANAAMADHLADVRDQFRAHEQRAKAQYEAVEKAAHEAAERYGDEFYAVKDTFLSATVGQVPPEVLSMVSDSDVMADLAYVLGEDPAELAKFVSLSRTNPNAAKRYIVKVEDGIKAELAKKPAQGSRNEQGQFTKAEPTPEPKRTSAPKPPSPVGGGSKGTFDVNDDSVPISEWLKQRQAQLARK